MQVRTYAKNNGVSVDDVLEVLTSNFGGNWLVTSKLTEQHTNYLNNVFTLSLPALPPSEQLATSQPSEIDVSEEKPTNITPLEKLQTVTSNVEIAYLQQNLDDDFQKFTDVFKKHDERKEAFLMGRLQTTYEKVKSHKPVEPVTVKDNLSEVDKMMSELKAMGIDIKS